MIVEQLLVYLKNIPPEAATVILAILPVVELRGALPVALLVYDLPPYLAVILAIIGNSLPIYPILIFLEFGAKHLRDRWSVADRFFNWLFERTRRKLEAKVDKYGVWALALFVAVPLPITGAWTGSIAAFIFGIPKRKALLSIGLGLIMAAAIVTLITYSASYTVRELFLL